MYMSILLRLVYQFQPKGWQDIGQSRWRWKDLKFQRNRLQDLTLKEHWWWWWSKSSGPHGAMTQNTIILILIAMLTSNLSLSIYIYIYVCMYVCMYICMYVCMYVCVCVSFMLDLFTISKMLSPQWRYFWRWDILKWTVAHLKYFLHKISKYFLCKISIIWYATDSQGPSDNMEIQPWLST
jgi:hypothetical protein